MANSKNNISDTPTFVCELEFGQAQQDAAPRQPATAQDVVTGRLMPAEGRDQVLVDYPGNPSSSPIAAVSTVVLHTADIGQPIALAFDAGDPRRPIVLGVLTDTYREDPAASDLDQPGDEVKISAEKSIQLTCGKASITLLHSGKVIIRGTHLISRSSGANKIKGGSIQLN